MAGEGALWVQLGPDAPAAAPVDEETKANEQTKELVRSIFEDELCGLLDMNLGPSSSQNQRATFSLDEVDGEEAMQRITVADEEQQPNAHNFIHRLNEREEVLYRKPPKIVNGYLFGSVLGEGSYGKVKECVCEQTLVRRAIKIIKLSRLRKIPCGKENVEREMRILRRLKHRNVVGLHDIFRNEQKQKLYLVMDYCVGSLQDMLDHATHKRFPIRQAHDYFTQLIDGLEYLHSQGVVHKDIKPGNLILDSDETVKLSDFGVAEELPRYSGSELCTSGQGTPKFQAPEIAAGHSDTFRGFPVDLWACGVTLYNFVSGQYPFEGAAILPLYQNIATAPLQMPSGVELEPNLQQLLQGLMAKDPEARFTIACVRLHPWLRKKQPRFEQRVSLPPRDGDYYRTLSVYPHLEILYGGGPDSACSSPPPDEHHENGEAARGPEEKREGVAADVSSDDWSMEFFI